MLYILHKELYHALYNPNCPWPWSNMKTKGTPSQKCEQKTRKILPFDPRFRPLAGRLLDSSRSGLHGGDFIWSHLGDAEEEEVQTIQAQRFSRPGNRLSTVPQDDASQRFVFSCREDGGNGCLDERFGGECE